MIFIYLFIYIYFFSSHQHENQFSPSEGFAAFHVFFSKIMASIFEAICQSLLKNSNNSLSSRCIGKFRPYLACTSVHFHDPCVESTSFCTIFRSFTTTYFEPGHPGKIQKIVLGSNFQFLMHFFLYMAFNALVIRNIVPNVCGKKSFVHPKKKQSGFPDFHWISIRMKTTPFLHLSGKILLANY